ncbi:hypothetical protein SD51_12840 [Alicyclobacillus tengchongensis]|nr:hypothetical protein SD51_12840 [Alicyclobacillus tengchongensis]
MKKTELLFQFDPLDPKFLTEGIWETPCILPGVRRIFVLIRVSTSKESQNTSIVHQLEHARNYARQNNVQVVRIYVVRDSGLTMDTNKTFAKLMADALEGQCDLLYLHSLSRLSRRSAHLDQFVTKLVRKKIKVYAYLEQFDTKKRGWKKELLNWGFIYEHESLSSSDRQKGSKRAQELRGRYLGVEAPYGFEKDVNKGLRPATDGTAEVVKEMFAMLLAGTSPCQIARILTERGVPCPSVKLGRNTSGKWNDTSIRKILRNPVYRGDILGRRTEVEVPGEPTRLIIPEDERVVHKGIIEGIVDSDVFDAAQKILEERGRGKKGAVVDFTKPGTDFLVDKLYCLDCGKPMTRVARNWGQIHYVCSTHVRKGGQCTGRHSIAKASLEQAIRTDVKSMVCQGVVLEGIGSALKAKSEQERAQTLKQIKSLQKQIERLQQRKVQIMANFYDRNIFDANEVEVDELKSDLAELLASTKAEIQEKQRKKQSLEEGLFSSSESMHVDYDRLLEERIDNLVRLLVTRIEIDVEGNVARIVYNCLPMVESTQAA